VSSAEDSSNMFMNCYSLTGGSGTVYSRSYTDSTLACTDNLPVKAGYFTQRGVTFSPSNGRLTLNGDKFDREDVWVYRENPEVKEVRAEPGTKLPENCDYLFGGPEPDLWWQNLAAFDLFEADTRHVTSMGGMFANLSKLTNLDLTTFDTSNVQFLDYMFEGCDALKTVDLTSFNIDAARSMGYMFHGCTQLKTIYVGDRWGGCPDGYEMFRDCLKLMGGNGTVYDSSRTDEYYARIDSYSQRGYLTQKTVAFKTNSMTLGGSIALNFYVQLDDIPESYLPDTYVEFEHNGQYDFVMLDPEKRNKIGYYGFTCPINSVSMADSVRATLHYIDRNGKSRAIRTRTTAENYLYRFNSSFGDKTWELIKAINDYGYYMQRYLSVHSAAPWELGVDHAAMEKPYLEPWSMDTQDYTASVRAALAPFKKTKTIAGDIEDIKYSLVLESDTTLNIKIKPKSGYTGNVKITLDGSTVTPKKLSDGRLQVSVRSIPAHRLGDAHTIKVTTGSKTSTFKASPLSYAYDCFTTTKDSSERYAMIALYRYYKTTVDYKN